MSENTALRVACSASCRWLPGKSRSSSKIGFSAARGMAAGSCRHMLRLTSAPESGKKSSLVIVTGRGGRSRASLGRISVNRSSSLFRSAWRSIIATIRRRFSSLAPLRFSVSAVSFADLPGFCVFVASSLSGEGGFLVPLPIYLAIRTRPRPDVGRRPASLMRFS